MSAFFNYLSVLFSGIPDALRPFRLVILLLAVAGSVFMGFGAMRFELDTSFDSWFSKDDPTVQALDSFRAQFGSDDGLFLVYRATDGDVFSPASLSAVRALTQDLENWRELDPEALGVPADVFEGLDHIQRVQSLANVRIQENTVDALVSRPLLPETGEITPEIAAAAERTAKGQSRLKLFMFSDNDEFGALVLNTDFGAIPVSTGEEVTAGFSEDSLDLAMDSFTIDVNENARVAEIKFEDTLPSTYTGFMQSLSAIYSQPEYSAAFDFYPIGSASMTELATETLVQSGYLVLAAMAIIVILLYTLFQTGSAVLWPVAAIGMSNLWLFGGMGWLSIPSSTLIALTIMLVLAVGIADCVHVMSEYLLFKREGMDHRAAMRQTFAKAGVPILLTSITTMAGMLSIAFGGTGLFVTFGVSSAIGVFLAFLFTIIVLPALLEYWHPHATDKAVKAATGWRRFLRLLGTPFRAIGWVLRKTGISWLLSAVWLQPLLEKVPAFSYRWRYVIIFVFTALFGVTFYGATQVKIDSNLVELFRKGTTLRTAYEIVDEHMAGTGSMEIMLDFKQSDALTDPRVLQAISDLQDMLEDKYGKYVVRTNSLADLVKETNKIMNDGDPAAFAIPKDPLAVAQLLYLFNSSNPEDRRAIVSDDYSRSHVSLQLRNAGSREYAQFFDGMQADIDAKFAPVVAVYPDMETSVTGSFALVMRMSDVISKSQFRSLTLAVVIISLIMTLTLGSIQGGLLAIVPNMLPAVLAFGLMGLLGIPLDTDTLMIAPLIIGIAVDDTIHLVTHYRMDLAKGMGMQKALNQTIKEVGQAVTFTTLVLGLAFAMLGFSDYLGLVKVGIFGSLSIFVALLCDLLFLPALIYVFKPRFGVKTDDDLPKEAI